MGNSIMKGEVQLTDGGEIVVTVPSMGEELRFKNLTELDEWSSNEEQTWRKIHDQRGALSRAGSRIADPLMAFFGGVRQAAHEGITNPDENTRSRNAKVAIDRLKPLADGLIPFSGSAIGELILSKIDQDPAVAIAHLAWMRDDIEVPGDGNLNVLLFVKAMVDARLEERFGERGVIAQDSALIKLRQRWHGVFSNLARQQKDTSTRFRSARHRLTRLAVERVRDYDTMREEHEAALAAMRAAFSTEMRLRASENYWNARRKVNDRRAKVARRWFFGWAAAGSVLLAIYYSVMLKVVELPEQALSTSNIVVFGVPAVVFVWILRLYYGQSRTAFDIANDAEERIAMVKAFKALEFEEKATEEERAIVLSALFRPYRGGGDEGVPHPVWDAVLRRTIGPANRGE